MKTDLYILGN